MDVPLRHISVRVPWHDTGWTGTICSAPQLNDSCAKLKRIAGGKNDNEERAYAGRSLDNLPRERWPCCVDENAAFMAPFEMVQVKRHALADVSRKHYGHFKPTMQRYPAYSAGIVPFRWMMQENLEYYRDGLELDVDREREPDLGFKSTWVNEATNQSSLLDGFAAHLRKDDSLCFFYAKHVPFVEESGRIIIGVGRVKEIGPLMEFDRGRDGMRGMVWERPVQHSIRPKGRDGFIMPYFEAMTCAEEDSSLDIERFAAKAPPDHWAEFSYASELVTHDGAIAGLLSMDTALSRMETELGIRTQWQRQWIHDELVRLWTVRGPFPGLGAVLTAFGMSRGVFVAHALQHQVGENADSWPLVDSVLNGSTQSLPNELLRDMKELAPIWKGLVRERRSFLRLLSRFELTVEQASALYDEGTRRNKGWVCTDLEILQNPYRIFEVSRHDPNGVNLLTVDRGVFPDDTVRLLHPLDEPARLDSAVDLRRIRAFTIAALEDASLNGHTLLLRQNVIEAVQSSTVQPECPVTGDMLTVRAPDMAPEVFSIEMDEAIGFQLNRYKNIGVVVRKQVLGRLSGRRHELDLDWNTLLDDKFGPTTDNDEKRARAEKAEALRELAQSRISVLIGPAGAGKTTVLGILCAQSEIRNDGLLLLAPTGKARVRMQELVGVNAAGAMTVAQFLMHNGRYDGASGRYFMSDRPKATGFGTVIVDESSMLTEDMLGALFNSLQGVKRFIFVGDPAQLPPIGAGRPFVDIVAKLRPEDYEANFPRVTPGYAELTIERRQMGRERPDIRLARWFSTTPPSAGEDDVLLSTSDEHPTLRFVEWQKVEEFQAQLENVLVEELKLTGTDDIRGFNRGLGSTSSGDYDYFNATRNGITGAVGSVDAWQILSPLRRMPFGIGNINRKLHERFRAEFIALASRQRNRCIPKPFGAERIVYGDKVLNLHNHRRDGRNVYPQKGALGYLANGEIGIAVGQWNTGGYPKILRVEFSSQQGFTYNFYGRDFREEGDASLELAYALTVHKAQGSQFDLVILVLPEGHPILSRELIYTALTRHLSRVVVMHQGPRSMLKDFAAPHRSETARRMTNLLQECRMAEFPQLKGSVFLQKGLIHRTSRGLAVRSKSEVIIADALSHAGVQFEYEKSLKLGGATRYPDFTIEDDVSGLTFFWEHLGLLHRDDYRRSWEKKLEWYRANGVLPHDEGGGPNGTLVITRDEPNGSIDSGKIAKLIQEILHD